MAVKWTQKQKQVINSRKPQSPGFCGCWQRKDGGACRKDHLHDQRRGASLKY